MNVSDLMVVVEDAVSEAVMKRLLAHVKYSGRVIFRIERGNGNIRKNIVKYKGASRVMPHLVFTDLDRYACPQALLEDWQVGSLPSTMSFRIAVREAEAWLLSDRQNIANYFMVAVEKVPCNPESLDDPKQAVFGVIRKSRKRRLVEEVIPQPGAHVGPLYNERMCDFVLNHWHIETAAETAPSLGRCLARISVFLH